MDARKGLPLDGLGLPSLARYAPKALMRGIAIENDVTCRIIGRCVYGGEIDREIGDMVRAAGRGAAFTYARYDVDLSSTGLADLGIDPRGQKLEMDNAGAIELFDEIGRKAIMGKDRFTRDFAGFLTR